MSTMRKINYTVTVYKNTGFNGTDIPSSGAVLENATKHVYPEAYYLREDIDLPSISINDSYHNLADVDYVKLVPVTPAQGEPAAFYYFAVPQATAAGTTVLNLELDALTTMGGAANVDYISGWQERGHIAKAEDELFANVAAEPWTPSQPLTNSNYEYLPETTLPDLFHPSDDLQIVISNIDLVSLGKNDGMPVTACGEIDPNTGQMTTTQMYVPEIQITDSATSFKMFNAVDSSFTSLSIPNTCAYDATNPVIKEGLKRLFSCGQLQLQGSYTLPKEYCIESVLGVTVTVCDADGKYSSICGSLDVTNVNTLPFEYSVSGYTVKNKKVYSTYRSYTLANIASGGAITKEANLLKHGNDTSPVVKVTSDPVSTGKVSAKFLSDYNADMPFVDVVNGAPWVNNQVLMEGAAGSLWNSISAAFTQQNLNRELQQNDIASTVARAEYDINSQLLAKDNWKDALGNVASLAGGVAAAAGGIAAIAAAAPTGGASIAAYGALAGGIGAAAMGGTNTAQMASRQTLKRQQMDLAYNQGVTNREFERQRINQSINENGIGLYKSNRCVAPTAMFTPEPNLAMYGLNRFVVYETRKTDEDLKSEDMYYQRYGYNGIHRPLTSACFNCRQYYCFVQAFDVNIKARGVSFGMRVRQKAVSQLNSGVRVWRVLPDPQYYETN